MCPNISIKYYIYYNSKLNASVTNYSVLKRVNKGIKKKGEKQMKRGVLLIQHRERGPEKMLPPPPIFEQLFRCGTLGVTFSSS